MRALEIIAGHVIYNPAYTYKFQLKTTNLGLHNSMPYFLQEHTWNLMVLILWVEIL